MEFVSELMVFAKVVETGSFSKAAQKLQLAKSSVSKKVAALEAKYQVNLIKRSTRKLQVTDAGQALYRHCQQLEQDIAAAEAQLTQLTGEPQGHLRVSAPPLFGQFYLSPLVPEFLLRYPEIQLELQFTEKYSDLISDRFDLLIRMGEQPDSSMIGQKLTEEPGVICAAPSYLQANAAPANPMELSEHNVLLWQTLEEKRLRTQPLGKEAFSNNGERHIVSTHGNLCSNDIRVLKEATCNGVGVGILPRSFVEPELADGQLVELLADYPRPPVPVYILYSRHSKMSAKQRAFIDLLKEFL